jgi:hypothetical protein
MRIIDNGYKLLRSIIVESKTLTNKEVFPKDIIALAQEICE